MTLINSTVANNLVVGNNSVVRQSGGLWSGNDGDSFNGILASGNLTLREAITFAPPGATVTFDASLSGQTITLGGTGLLIDKDLTIDASSLAGGLSICGNNASRVMQIDSNVSLHGLTLCNGLATLRRGIYITRGDVDLYQCTVEYNSTISGGNDC